MKTLIALSLVLLSACASQTPTAIQTRSDVQAALPYIRPGASVACSAILALAVSQQDQADVAGDVYAISSVINSMSGGTVVTPQALHDAIALVAPKSSEYAVLATTVQGIWAGLYPQIKGDPALALQCLNALSAGCNDAATAFMTRPVGNPTPAH